MIIRTTKEIFENPWGDIKKEEEFPSRTPAKCLNKKLSFEDVEQWEELYYFPGTIGVYASWKPYSEFYIIVHNLYLDRNHTEIYQGEEAIDRVIDRCKKYGIELDVSTKYIPD